MFGRRPDATQVRDLSPMRRFMPFVSPRRNASLFYFAQPLDAEPALAFLDRVNAARPPERAVTFFHLVLRAIARILHEKPRMNRFVAGGRLWQRDGVWLTFSAKRAFSEDAPILTVKRRFERDETLLEMVDALYERLAAGRRGDRSTSDREIELLLHLPPPIVRFAMWLARGADACGLLPRGMIDADPLFTSVFVANVGSVGLAGGYHHLWEWGTCGIFCVLGRVEAGPDGRRRVVLKYSYDERIEDGFNAALGLEQVRDWLENPEKL